MFGWLVFNPIFASFFFWSPYCFLCLPEFLTGKFILCVSKAIDQHFAEFPFEIRDRTQSPPPSCRFLRNVTCPKMSVARQFYKCLKPSRKENIIVVAVIVLTTYAYSFICFQAQAFADSSLRNFLCI